MNRENPSGDLPSGRADAVATDRVNQPSLPGPREASSGIAIDFHSPEFNLTDGLDDYAGDYRAFQPLDGVVTADMRHQAERGQKRDAQHRAGDDTVLPEAAPTKRVARERGGEETPDDAPPLTIVSRGRTLIVGTDTKRCLGCGERLGDQGLTCTLLLTNPSTPVGSFPLVDPFPLLEVSAVSIAGAFGGFSALVTAKGEQGPLSAWLGDEATSFDLVLDLQATPSFAGECLPMGYYAPGMDPGRLSEALTELPEMRGRFRRPQFVAFRKERCLHGRSRTLECRECVAVCPFGAIRSADRAITIDHHRCQGCGGCAVVCPADAIRRVHPSLEELLDALRRALDNRSARTASPPTLVILQPETDDQGKGPRMEGGNRDHGVRFEVEQIGHVGVEVLLSALAYGADAVVVSRGAPDSAAIGKALQRQVEMGKAILRGIGMQEEKIRFTDPPSENNSETEISLTDVPAAGFDRPFLPAAFAPGHDKRTAVRRATQHLYDQSAAREPWIPLPGGSPFGAVAVDPVVCTLCMACAVACPTQALSARGDLPELLFYESRCHQCGLCEATCPERAIRLLPRLLCDPVAVETPSVMHKAEPVRCIECGVPFASEAVINRVQGKLAGHWMYAEDRQLRRLRMCRTCRTRDALMSKDLKSWDR